MLVNPRTWVQLKLSDVLDVDGLEPMMLGLVNNQSFLQGEEWEQSSDSGSHALFSVPVEEL